MPAFIGGGDGERCEPAGYLNNVIEPKRSNNRIHVDPTNPDPAAIDELVRLGATVIGNSRYPASPEPYCRARSADGHAVSSATVERALRRRGRLPPRDSALTASLGWRCGARCSTTRTERNRVWQTDFSAFVTLL